MKVVLQRVNKAQVIIKNKIFSQIGKGLLIFVGFEKGDTQKDLSKMAQKIVNLRIFEDENKKMNLSALDIKAEILCVSEFTLCAEVYKGRRPSFHLSLEPQIAERFYQDFIDILKSFGLRVEKGIFGESMKILLENAGPVTFILDSKEF